MAKAKPEGKRLYRRAWAETSNPLVEEARAQTLALQRLQVWLRLTYAILALAVLVSYWGFSEGGAFAFGVVGAIVGVVDFVFVVILRTGIDHGRKNVNAILDELQKPS